jgi:GntR family transcriptional regulator, sialic acid-inducible nan operon repressor
VSLDVARTKLSETLVSYFARQIVGGTIGPGEPLPSEPSIAARFGVSKPIVREMVQTLASLGMVIVQQGKRTIVLPDKGWDVLDLRVQEAFQMEGRGHELNRQLYEARVILERSAASLAAKRATNVDVEELQLLVAEMSEISAAKPDLNAFLLVDRAFHERVAEASANRVLRQVIREVHRYLASAWSTSTIEVDELPGLVHMHEVIAHAIAEGNAEAAAEAVDFHLTNAANKDAARYSVSKGRTPPTAGHKSAKRPAK